MKAPKTISKGTAHVYGALWPNFFGLETSLYVKVRKLRHQDGTIEYQFYAPYIAKWENAQQIGEYNLETIKKALP